MKTALLILIAVSTGCGFGLTPDTLHCGVTEGFDVYLDTADGGFLMPTCQQTSDLVKQAIQVGVVNGIWPADHQFTYRLEIINAGSLQEIGYPDANGRTTTAGVYDMALSANTFQPGGLLAVMVHEMIHASGVGHDNNDHCDWSIKYQPILTNLATQTVGSYVDECQHVQCFEGGGASCSAVAK